jgi:hypothetical protein
MSKTCVDMPPYQGSAAFERMKSLVGRWSGESPEMGKMNTEFRLIAGDSVVEERFAEGTPMEMLSVYHDVNGKLTMTHYCMLRNQPRMKLVKQTTDSLTFDLAPTPGLNVPEGHAHARRDLHLHRCEPLQARRRVLERWQKRSPCGPPVDFHPQIVPEHRRTHRWRGWSAGFGRSLTSRPPQTVG